VAVQPVPDRIPVHAQLVGDLGEWPPLPGHAVSQVGVQAGEAELGGTLGEALVSGPAALVGGAHPARWWDQARVVEQAAATTVVMASSLASRARLACGWQRATR
jgi:hypothetical protein